MKKFRYEGSIDYPEVGIIRDEDVYNLIMKHSRWIDRLSKTKWVEMTLWAQNILMRIFPEIDSNDPTWRFYGKNNISERF